MACGRFSPDRHGTNFAASAAECSAQVTDSQRLQGFPDLGFFTGYWFASSRGEFCDTARSCVLQPRAAFAGLQVIGE